MKRTLSLFLLGTFGWQASALAGGLTCTGADETLLSWPATDPVWELCWVPPASSSGPQGSGLELRNVHYRGIQVLKTAHAPLLFAEYTSSTCYRDWKDNPASFIAESQVRNQLGVVDAFQATTSCDRSKDPIASYGRCPFSLAGHTNADCFNGVAIEDNGDHVVLTTQYDASWYAYSSRFILYMDGSFSPIFGFGNFDGTGSATTHWHHNYWRLDFDIDGPDNDVLSINDEVQATEFTSLRDLTGGPGGVERTWEVRDTVTDRGYRVLPATSDYVTPTNESGRGFHMTDVLGTVYKPNEYGDLSNNPLGSCAMGHDNLVNGENLAGGTGEGTDVVLYYRVAVRDQTAADTMICKSAGPVFQPLGDWGAGTPDPVVDLSIAFAPATVPPAVPGSTVTFGIDVENAGPDDATDVAVELVLPPQLVFESGRAAAANKLQTYIRGSEWSCADDLGTVTCNLATALAAGTPAPALVIEALVADAAEAGSVSVSATVVAVEEDSDAVNNEATIDVEIEAKPEPDAFIFCDGFEKGGDGSCGDGGPVEPGDIVVFDDVNFTVPATFSGGAVQWTTGQTCECDQAPHNFNIWTTGGNAAFFWPGGAAAGGGGVATGTVYDVLASGAVIGPSSNFSSGLGAEDTVNWRLAEGVDGYLGFKFVNPDTSEVNYGYVHITTTGTTGHPATIVGWAYNSAGDPITIP